MAKVIAGMTMSLDGLVADRNGSVEQLETIDVLQIGRRTSLRFRVKR